MQTTIDEITKRKIRIGRETKVILINEEHAIFGYTNAVDQCVHVFSRDYHFDRCNYACPTSLVDNSRIKGFDVIVPYDLFKSKLFFSNRHGYYMFRSEWSEDKILYEQLAKYPYGGNTGVSFPYHFKRTYEAVNHLKLFEGKQTILDRNKGVVNETYLTNEMDYTFGLEFETSAGMIPERICFRDGLIPLRDGSISGFEYSTVVMNAKDGGIALLKQQLDTLKKYTIFNKDCSLHIHFGNYPMKPEKVYALYRMCYQLQPHISGLVPDYTFNSAQYKSSQKDYCKKLPFYENFKEFYYSLVGKNYLGSLEQPHPLDPTRERKWNISTRYYYVNFINLICYKVNKTVEFRLLRPTYNFAKIKLWMYIFNAILKFSDKYSEKIVLGHFDNVDLEGIIRDVYPAEVAKSVNLGLEKLRILRETQRINGDHIGSDLTVEDVLFV